MSDAIFVRNGELFEPTERAGSPWGEGLLHGGPPAGLLARAIEQFAAGEMMFVSRLTIDLFRPVPKQPLSVRAETIRSGNRIHVAQAGLYAGDTEVSRATALLLRRTQLEMSPTWEGRPMPPGPDGIEVSNMRGPAGREGPPPATPPGFHTTIEVKWVSRPGSNTGANIVWVRVPVPMVAGEEMTPLVRVASISDFGSAFSGMGSRDGFGWINADITLYLHRLPEGEWIGIEAARDTEPHGLGVAYTTLYDHRGPIGHTTHAVLANQRR